MDTITNIAFYNTGNTFTNSAGDDYYDIEDEFNDYQNIGLEMGFKVVKSGSLVRSSYHADEGI